MKRPDPSLNIRQGRIDMTHGSGGRASARLIAQIFAKAFDNPALAEANDQARLTLPSPGQRLAFSSDSFVISPLFFPGGTIGSLAVHGTVNDIAMAGAKPLWLSAGFIIEEGFPLSDLDRIVTDMAEAARQAGVAIVTGDTKVVEKGKADGLYINTSGIGVFDPQLDLSAAHVRAGDAILLSGPIGDHGVAILAHREGMSFATPLLSDSAPLNHLVDAMIKSGVDLHALRDPTRGGLGTTLNEIASTAQVGMHLDERSIPVRPAVQGACELLGLDPLYIANEGRLIAFCPADQADQLLQVMRSHPDGRDAAIIGKVVPDDNAWVQMDTVLGGTRMVDWLNGEPLPRIC